MVSGVVWEVRVVRWWVGASWGLTSDAETISFEKLLDLLLFDGGIAYARRAVMAAEYFILNEQN
jgi:hypothetical protein